MVETKVCSVCQKEKPIQKFRSKRRKCRWCDDGKPPDYQPKPKGPAPKEYPREDIINDVRQVIQRAIESGHMDRKSKFSHASYILFGGKYPERMFYQGSREGRFGGFAEAVKAANDGQISFNFGIDINRHTSKRPTDESFMVVYNPGMTTCLKCSKMFDSWDVKRNRQCDHCKASELYDDDTYAAGIVHSISGIGSAFERYAFDMED